MFTTMMMMMMGTMAGITVIIISNKHCYNDCSINWHLDRISYVPGAILSTLKILTRNLQNNPMR